MDDKYFSSRLDVKKHTNEELYYKQINMLKGFLERGAISQAQYEKSTKDLTRLMKFSKNENNGIIEAEYRELTADEVELPLFAYFDRTQEVTKCYRKIDGEWTVQDVVFTDNWTAEEYKQGVLYLKKLIVSGGYAVGAFIDGKLKGFSSVEADIFGTTARYMDLSNIHVSRDMRGKGIGKELFRLSKKWAKLHNAEKLYISAHSAVESQAFYKAMGCVEAVEYNSVLAEKEPCDCQLECLL